MQSGDEANVTLPHPPQTILTTTECSALRLAALAGVSAFYADLSRDTGTIIVVLTFCSPAVYAAARFRLFYGTMTGVAVAVFLSPAFRLEAVAASLFGMLCFCASHFDLVQIAVAVLVVRACLHRTL